MTENPRQDPMPDSNTPQASYPQVEAPTLQEGHDMQNSAASDAPLVAYASITATVGFLANMRFHPRTGDLTGNLPAKFVDLDISTR